MGPSLSFLIGTISTMAAIFSGFDPDKAIGPVMWHAVAGLAVGLIDLKPRIGAVVAGIAAFPIVLFVYLAIFHEVGNIWPIAMMIHGIIAAVPFFAGYVVGLLIRLPLSRSRTDIANVDS